MAYDPSNNPYVPGDPYAYDLKWVVEQIKGWKDPADSADRAKASEDAAKASELNSEAWAVGEKDGEPVDPAEPQHDNNSKFWAGEAADRAGEAKDYADHIADPVAGLVTDWLNDHITQPTTPAIDTSLSVAGAAADAKAAGDKIADLNFNDKLTNGNITDVFGLGSYNTGAGTFISTSPFAWCFEMAVNLSVYIKSINPIRAFIRSKSDGSILQYINRTYIIELPADSTPYLVEISDANQSWGTSYTDLTIEPIVNGLICVTGGVSNIITPNCVPSTTSDGATIVPWNDGEWATYKLHLNKYEAIKIFVPSSASAFPLLYTYASGTFTPIINTESTNFYTTYCASDDMEVYVQIRTKNNNVYLDPPIFYTEKKPESTCNLNGINLCAIGDSYLRNNGRNVNQTWCSKLAVKYGMNYTNLGIDGGGICAIRGGIPAIKTRYTNIPLDSDLIILEGGENDANVSYDIDTFKAEFDTLIQDIRALYYNAKLIVMCPWGDAFSARTAIKPYAEAMRDTCYKYGIPFFNSWIEYVYNATADARGLYYQASTDSSHLNNTGHDIFLPMIESFIKSVF